MPYSFCPKEYSWRICSISSKTHLCCQMTWEEWIEFSLHSAMPLTWLSTAISWLNWRPSLSTRSYGIEMPLLFNSYSFMKVYTFTFSPAIFHCPSCRNAIGLLEIWRTVFNLMKLRLFYMYYDKHIGEFWFEKYDLRLPKVNMFIWPWDLSLFIMPNNTANIFPWPFVQ